MTTKLLSLRSKNKNKRERKLNATEIPKNREYVPTNYMVPEL